MERSVAARFGVNGYPALRWFAAGEVSDYHGGQTADDLEDWVISRGGPLVKALANDSAAELFRLSYPLVVVASLHAPPAPDKVETLRQLCSAVDARCGLKQIDTPSNESVTLHRASDDASVTYTGELTDLLALRRFFIAHSLPPLLPSSATALHEALTSAVDVVAMLLLPGDPDADSTGMVTVSRFAFEVASAVFRSQELPVACAILAPRGQSAGLIPAFFGTETLPAVVVYNKTSHERHASSLFGERDVHVEGDLDETKVSGSERAASLEVATDCSADSDFAVCLSSCLNLSACLSPSREFSPEPHDFHPLQVQHLALNESHTIVRFVSAVMARNATSLRLSAEAPAQPSARDAATVLVATTYEGARQPRLPKKLDQEAVEVVEVDVSGGSRPSNDAPLVTIVLHYTSWCTGCATLEARFDELARHYAAEGRVHVAKIDVGENEVWVAEGGQAVELPSVRIFRVEAGQAVEAAEGAPAQEVDGLDVQERVLVGAQSMGVERLVEIIEAHRLGREVPSEAAEGRDAAA